MASVPGVGEPDSGNNWESEQSTDEELYRVGRQLISDDRPNMPLETEPYVRDCLLGTHVNVCITRERKKGTYEEGTDKRIGDHNKLVPIKGGERIQSQTGHATGNCTELGVMRGNPSDPVEVRHRLYDVVGEPEVDEHGGKTVHEPPHPGHCPAIDHTISFCVKGTIESNGRQVGGPDSLGRVDEESTS